MSAVGAYTKLSGPCTDTRWRSTTQSRRRAPLKAAARNADQTTDMLLNSMQVPSAETQDLITARAFRAQKRSMGESISMHDVSELCPDLGSS